MCHIRDKVTGKHWGGSYDILESVTDTWEGFMREVDMDRGTDRGAWQATVHGVTESDTA